MEKEPTDAHKKIILPIIALAFSLVPLAFILLPLNATFSIVALLSVILAPLLGIILSIVSFCSGKDKIGSKGVTMAIIALLLSIFVPAIFVITTLVRLATIPIGGM